MTEFKNHNRLIEAYLDRSIIELERDALEREAANNPQLAQKLRLQRESLMALELICQDEARLDLSKTLHDIKTARNKQKRRWIQLAIGIAAGLLISMSAIWGIPLLQKLNQTPIAVEQKGPPDPVNLAVSYFEPHELSLRPSRTTRIHRLIERSQSAYKAAQYAEAIPDLQALLKASPRRTDARLALGICYLALDSTSQAAQHFIPIIDRGRSHTEEARWYLALTYFRESMLIQALGLMEQIAGSPEHFKQVEAKEFLLKLKGVKG